MKKKSQGVKSNRDAIARYVFCLGIVSLAFIFFTYTIAMLGFVVKIPISPYHILIALLLTVVTCIVVSWHYYGQDKPINLKVALSLVAVFAVLLLSSRVVASNVYDISFDGQWYHQGAVHQLVNGYDPLYGEVPESYPGGIFISHYPKAFEISSAVINAFTHHVEDGKSLNLLLMVTSFLLVFPAILSSFPKVNFYFALLIGALCAFNPISICQSMSYYVDGASASLLAMLAFLLILSYKKMDKALFLVISCIAILAINYKVFNLVYVGLIIAGSIIIGHICKKATALHYLLAISLFIGVIFGINPYITNLIDHSTPFYPVEGVSTSMIAKDMPQNFPGMSPPGQFLYSIFSGSDYQKANASLKIPFTFSLSELDAFTQTDARVSGFGPLFSGLFLLTLILIVLLLYVNFKNKVSLNNPIYLMCLLIFITVIINPASWWARYVPQLWTIPLLLVLCANQQFTGKLRNLKIFNYAIVLFMVLNVLIVALIYYPNQLNITGQINRQLDQLKYTSQQKPIKIYLGVFSATEDRYKDYGINYTLLDSTLSEKGYRLGFSYDISTFYV